MSKINWTGAATAPITRPPVTPQKLIPQSTDITVMAGVDGRKGGNAHMAGVAVNHQVNPGVSVSANAQTERDHNLHKGYNQFGVGVKFNF